MTMTEWFSKHPFTAMIGLAGVHQQERQSVRKLWRLFVVLMLVLALSSLIEWQLELDQHLNTGMAIAFNSVVWALFVVSWVVLVYLVRQRTRFIRQNWLLLAMIVLGVPFMYNYEDSGHVLIALRPFFSLLLMVPALGMLGRFFLDGRLLTTLLSAAVIVLFFGLLVAGIDPNIQNGWDGIWWALATVSTVGYGDVVPQSFLGRLMGAMLVVLGLGVFVVITANFLALIVRERVVDQPVSRDELNRLWAELHAIQASQSKLIDMVTLLKQELKRDQSS